MIGRPTLLGSVRTVAALGVAATVTVALAQQPARSAFTGTTGSSGNQVTAAAQFCASPGTTTLTAVGDTWINEASPNTNVGTDYHVQVSSQAASNARGLVRFSLPGLPTGCAVSSADFRLYNDSPAAGRTIEVYRVDPTAPLWTETGVTWATRPPAVGTAATSVTGASGYQSWTVTSQVGLIYSSGIDNGFLVRDQTEGGTNPRQYYQSRAGGSPPRLVLSWD
jgi:hypothetical protein